VVFLKYRGTILASGSKKGYYSWGSESGGFYTVQFLDSLNEELSKSSGRPSWENLMSRADKVMIIKPAVIQPPKDAVIQPPQSKVEVTHVERGGEKCDERATQRGEECDNTPPPGANWTCVTPEEKVGDKICCDASNGKRECWGDVW
jgi:hypothetical protein